MTPAADAVADCVLAAFHQLPDKRKPRPQRDVSAEWVPLTGIVLSTDGALVCVSLGSVLRPPPRPIGSSAFPLRLAPSYLIAVLPAD
jgi:tRNA-specific adenosine deaminase 1